MFPSISQKGYGAESLLGLQSAAEYMRKIKRESQGLKRHKTQVLPSCFPTSTQRERTDPNIFSKPVLT